MQVSALRGEAAGPSRRDWGLAALLLVPSLAQVVLDPIAPRPLGVVVAAGSVLPVAWRRVHPAAAAVVGTSFWLVPTEGYLVLGFVVAAVLFFAVGAHLRSDVAAVAVTAWGTAVGVYSILTSGQAPETAFVLLVVVVAPVVGGRVVAEWQRRAATLADLAEQLAVERDRAEELAVSQERTRIARELHDVVGHDVTVIALQADAAAAALARDPSRAAEPVEAIRRTAAHTLTEMRRVVVALRSADGDAEGVEPPPGTEAIRDLVAHSRSVGQEVALSVAGRPQEPGGSVGLAVVRILQESLTNARRHAPGARVCVGVHWGTDAVDLRVASPLTGPVSARPGGLGLLGMQERARMLGGHITAGPGPGGEFLVAAHLPYDPPPLR